MITLDSQGRVLQLCDIVHATIDKYTAHSTFLLCFVNRLGNTFYDLLWRDCLSHRDHGVAKEKHRCVCLPTCSLLPFLIFLTLFCLLPSVPLFPGICLSLTHAMLTSRLEVNPINHRYAGIPPNLSLLMLSNAILSSAPTHQLSRMFVSWAFCCLFLFFFHFSNGQIDNCCFAAFPHCKNTNAALHESVHTPESTHSHTHTSARPFCFHVCLFSSTLHMKDT